MKLVTDSSFSQYDKVTDINTPVKFRYKFIFKAYDPDSGWMRDLTQFIKYISVFNEIDDGYFPITKIDFVLDKYSLVNMYNARESIRYLMQIQIAERDEKSEMTQASEELYLDIGDQIELVTLDFPKVDFIEQFFADSVDNEKIKENISDVPDIPVTMEFFKISHIKSSNTLINRSYTKASSGIAAAAVLSLQQNQFVMMQQPHGSKVYEHIVVPPLNMNNSINFIQDNYMIYNNDILLYHDYWTTFLMDKEQRDCPPIMNFGYMDYPDATIEIVSENTPTTEVDGIIKSETLKIRTTNNPTVINSEQSTKQINGQNFIMTSFNNEERVTKKEFDLGGTKNIEKEVYLQHSYAEDIQDRIKSNFNTTQTSIEVYVSHCDFRLFTPERKYDIVVDSTNNQLDIPEGKYVLNKSILTFNRYDYNSNTFDMNATLLMSKQNS